MADADMVWDEEMLDRFIENPPAVQTSRECAAWPRCRRGPMFARVAGRWPACVGGVARMRHRRRIPATPIWRLAINPRRFWPEAAAFQRDTILLGISADQRHSAKWRRESRINPTLHRISVPRILSRSQSFVPQEGATPPHPCAGPVASPVEGQNRIPVHQIHIGSTGLKTVLAPDVAGTLYRRRRGLSLRIRGSARPNSGRH
jgi:hypothetical protein